MEEVKRDLFTYWDQFVDEYMAMGGSEATIRRVKLTLNLIYKESGIETIEDCNSPIILRSKLITLMKDRDWTEVTYNTHLKSIKAYFNWLYDYEYVEVNNIGKIRKAKEKNKEQRTLTQSQVDALVNYVSRHNFPSRLGYSRNVFLVNLALSTGARTSEISALKCKDVYMEGGSLKIVIKGKKQKGRPRYYKMKGALKHSYEMYMKCRREYGREEELLFISCSDSNGLTTRGIQAFFTRCSKALGFSVTNYSIRRYVATKLDKEGFNLKKIGDFLGHTRLSTTQRYIERSASLTEDGIDMLGKNLKKLD